MKVVDGQAELRKTIEDAEDRMKREVRKVRQQQKTTTAYVEQKTCTVMEALGLLGNSVHEMMEKMVDILQEVPEGLQDVIDSIPTSSSVGLDANSNTSLSGGGDVAPLAIIQKMQDDWNRLAKLINVNLPAAKRLEDVAKASRSPTPIPVPHAQQSTEIPSTATPLVVDTAKAAEVVDLPPTLQSPLSIPDKEVAQVESRAASHNIAVPDGHSGGGPDGDNGISPGGNSRIAPDGDVRVISSAAEAPPGGDVFPDGQPAGEKPIDLGSPLSEEDDGVVGSKRKHNEDEEPSPVEKKKKKAAAPKKRAAGKRRVPRGKTADPAPVEEDQLVEE